MAKNIVNIVVATILASLILMLVFANSLVSAGESSGTYNVAVTLFASKIGMTKVDRQGFSISGSKTVYLNVEGHYRNPSELHYLFTNVTSMFAVKLQQLKGPVFGEEMFELGNSTLRSITEAYEAVIGSNVRDLLFANVSVLTVSNGTYQIVAFYKVDYNGVLTDQAIEVSVWINSTYAKIKIVDPVSLMFHRNILVPTSPSPQVKSSIIREIDEVTGVNWSDVMITPVLYKYGNAVIPAYKVEAYRPINDSFAMFLTAYVLPNMTVLSKNVTVSPYFGLGSSTPAPGLVNNVGSSYVPLLIGLMTSALATTAVIIALGRRIRSKIRPVGIAVILLTIVAIASISGAMDQVYCSYVYSTNWSGYVVHVSNILPDGWIFAVFPVASFSGAYDPYTLTKMGQWVGFGGYHINTLIQAGVGYFYVPGDYFYNSQPLITPWWPYWAWFEVLPLPPMLVFKLFPGEEVYTLIANLSYVFNTSTSNNDWIIAQWVTVNNFPIFAYEVPIPDYSINWSQNTADFIVEGAGLYAYNNTSNTTLPLELSINDSVLDGIGLYYLPLVNTTAVPIVAHYNITYNITFLFFHTSGEYIINYAPTPISPPGNFTVVNATPPFCYYALVANGG